MLKWFKQESIVVQNIKSFTFFSDLVAIGMDWGRWVAKEEVEIASDYYSIQWEIVWRL